jgi:hypothetical protein
MIGIAKFPITRPDALAPSARAADLSGGPSRFGTAATCPCVAPRNPYRIGELAGRWRGEGYIPPNADTNAVAANVFSLMHGLIVMHHIVDDVPADALRKGLSLLGAAVVGPYTLPATQPQEA